MAKTIILDKVQVPNVQLSRKEGDWLLAINYIMTGQAEAKRHGGTKIFELDAQQQTQVRNFLKPFVSALKTEIDIQAGEEWADQ